MSRCIVDVIIDCRIVVFSNSAVLDHGTRASLYIALYCTDNKLINTACVSKPILPLSKQPIIRCPSHNKLSEDFGASQNLYV